MFEFASDGSPSFSLLVGLNGTGKSQLLELIGEVFCYLERYKRADFKIVESLPFSVNIVYQIRANSDTQKEVKYEVEINDIEVKCSQLSTDNTNQSTSSDSLPDPLPLPDHVVAYSSSFNDNLQRPFLKNAIRFFDTVKIRGQRLQKKSLQNVDDTTSQLIDQRYAKQYKHLFSIDDYGRIQDKETASPLCIFIDPNSILIAILARYAEHEFTLKRLIQELTHHKIKSVTIRYNFHNVQYIPDAVDDLKQLISIVSPDQHTALLSRSHSKIFEEESMPIRGEVTLDFNSLEVLEKFRLTYYHDALSIFYKLYKLQLISVANWPTTLKQDLRKDDFMGNARRPIHNPMPVEITDMQLTDGASSISIHDLSDGEFQILSATCLASLFESSEDNAVSKNNLILLDEPETHLNPHWRTEFHERLTRVSQKNTHYMISTHSPFLLSSLDKHNIYQFSKEAERVIFKPANEQTFGASFEFISKSFFGLNSLISSSAVKTINDYLQNRDTNESAIQWIEENVGESMEKSFLITQLKGNASKT